MRPKRNLPQNMSAGGWMPPELEGWTPPDSRAHSNAQMSMMGATGMINPWMWLLPPAFIAGVKGYNYFFGEPEPGQQYGRPGDPPHPSDGPTKQAADMLTRGYEKGGIFDQAIHGGPHGNRGR